MAFLKFIDKLLDIQNIKKKKTMSNIEQLQNSIELLKRALTFYAEKDNYIVKHNQNNTLFSYIEMDNGVQARFALEKLEQIENLYIDIKKKNKELENENADLRQEIETMKQKKFMGLFKVFK